MQEEPSRKPRHPRISTVLWLGLLIFIVLLLGLEGAARLPQIQKKIPIKSFGFTNSLFEIKWVKLEQYVNKYGVPDVIIVGNSMVNTGIDPLVIEQQIMDSTGKSLSIFNFGVEGLNITAMDDMANLLVRTYHPKILVVGTDIRDYTINLDNLPSNEFVSTPWLETRLNQFNLKGIVINSSHFLQYALVFRNWYLPGFSSSFTKLSQEFTKEKINTINDSGYQYDARIPPHRYIYPNEKIPADRELLHLFRDFNFDQSRFNMLAGLIDKGKKNGSEVIVIEMPLQKTMYQFFNSSSEIRNDFLQLIRPITLNSGAKLIESSIYASIPDKDWANRTHLNLNGAPIFSRFLAEELIKLPEIQKVLQ